MRQVLINLLRNAARFTERGGVAVEARRDDGSILVSVADTGTGIASEDLPRLFQEFSQVGGSSDKAGSGSGLGLAVSRRCVELHGGRMWAESELQRGTTFYFTLPLETSVVTYSAPSVDDPRLARLVRTADGPRTLVVVDPDPASAKILRRYLDGYEVTWLPRPRRGRRASDLSAAAAVVITSQHGDSDLERLRRMGQLPSGVPVALFSMPGPGGLARSLGVSSYLLKPVGREEVRRALAEFARRAKTVLVVDDEPDMVRLLARLVQATLKDCRVLRAYGGAEALGLLRSERPDLVLLDLLMPDVSGYGVIAQMKAEPELSSIPIVVVTARGDADEAVTAPTITITRDGGLPVGDLVCCLRASLDALAARSRPDTWPTPRADPPG